MPSTEGILCTSGARFQLWLDNSNTPSCKTERYWLRLGTWSAIDIVYTDRRCCFTCFCWLLFTVHCHSIETYSVVIPVYWSWDMETRSWCLSWDMESCSWSQSCWPKSRLHHCASDSRVYVEMNKRMYRVRLDRNRRHGAYPVHGWADRQRSCQTIHVIVVSR